MTEHIHWRRDNTAGTMANAIILASARLPVGVYACDMLRTVDGRCAAVMALDDIDDHVIQLGGADKAMRSRAKSADELGWEMDEDLGVEPGVTLHRAMVSLVLLAHGEDRPIGWAAQKPEDAIDVSGVVTRVVFAWAGDYVVAAAAPLDPSWASRARQTSSATSPESMPT